MATKLKKGKDKKICGVASGFANYFNIDITLMRLLFVLVLLVTGVLPVVIFYIIACIIMPEK